MPSLIASTQGFSTSHIALTAGITGLVSLAAGILVLGRRRSGLANSLAAFVVNVVTI